MILQNIQALREKTNYGQTYLHPKIKDLPNEQINQIIHTVNMRYTPYQSDTVNDSGWGCAWRSIQMILSSQYNINPEFRWLFSFFGKKEVLEAIYKDRYKTNDIPEYLSKANYAPQELDNGWAEPYIGCLILHYMGFETKLFLINGYPPNSNAPQGVFDIIMNFFAFKNFLLDHFRHRKSPIQIDDSKYSMVIHDCKFEQGRTILYIGDPHIYYIKDNKDKIGLYQVVLDEQGNQLSHSITQEQEQYYMYKNSYTGITFGEKKWMAVCITKKLDVWQEWRERQLII